MNCLCLKINISFFVYNYALRAMDDQSSGLEQLQSDLNNFTRIHFLIIMQCAKKHKIPLASDDSDQYKSDKIPTPEAKEKAIKDNIKHLALQLQCFFERGIQNIVSLVSGQQELKTQLISFFQSLNNNQYAYGVVYNPDWTLCTPFSIDYFQHIIFERGKLISKLLKKLSQLPEEVK